MSKLHLENLGAPLCGRQLNIHRDTNSQLADRAVFASSLGELIIGLQHGKACRHCGRAAGVLPKLTRAQRDLEPEDDLDEE